MCGRARHATGWLIVPLLMHATLARAAQPLRVPEGAPVYSAPMATIEGRGAVPFHITLGMLVTRDMSPVGLYRSYPSKSAVALSEQYGLGMLGTTDGVILASYGQVPLLVLHGHVGADVGVYALSVSYLTGISPRRYGHCTIRVAHTPQGQWETVDGNDRPITSFVVESSRFGIRGISPCD